MRHGPVATPERSRRTAERGSSLLAVVLVVLILGVLAALVLGGGFANPSTPERANASDAVRVCLSDYQTVSNAIQDYFDANLAEPPAGTAWATSSRNGGPFLTAWPADPGAYTLVWNGRQLDVQPASGADAAGSRGTAHPATGCYAA